MRMMYSETLLDHFEHPRHVGRLDSSAADVGTGWAGSEDTGGVLRIQLRADRGGLISEARFQAYGPPALIAAGSWLCDTIVGASLEAAQNIDYQVIVAALGLPPERLHCALFAHDAVTAAINEYREKQRVTA